MDYFVRQFYLSTVKIFKFIILIVQLKQINNIKIKSPCRKIWTNKFDVNTNIVQETNRSIAHDDFNNSMPMNFYTCKMYGTSTSSQYVCVWCKYKPTNKKKEKNNKNNNNWFDGILSRAPPLKFDWMWKWSWLYTQHTPHVYLWPTGCNM